MDSIPAQNQNRSLVLNEAKELFSKLSPEEKLIYLQRLRETADKQARVPAVRVSAD